MSLFSGRYRYTLPERLSKEEARQRRLAAVLERSRKELEDRTSGLSPANVAHLERVKDFQRKVQSELETRRRNFEALNKELKSPQVIRRHKAAMSRLFQLHAKAMLDGKRATKGARGFRDQASASDRRFFNPLGSLLNARTYFGTEARSYVSARGKRMFVNPLMSLPCVDRLVRREVMFAKKKAGRGYRVPHRFGPMSMIGC